jgi:phosphatidylglycerophosphate synthase
LLSACGGVGVPGGTGADATDVGAADGAGSATTDPAAARGASDAAGRASEAASGADGGSRRWHAETAKIQAKTREETRVGSGQLMGAREVYQKTKKVPDLFWNRFVCRPVGAVVVDVVKGTGITPNQITLASFAVGIVSAALIVALPGRVGLIVAVLVYQASYVLDCADGMLARWRGIASPAGHLLDFLMDELKAFAILGAAAVRLHCEHPDQPFLLIGIGGLMSLASGIALTSFQRHPAIAPPKSDAQPSQSPLARLVRFIESGAKFLIHYPSYILFVAFSGRLEFFLYPYVAVNALYAARTWLSVALRFARSS